MSAGRTPLLLVAATLFGGIAGAVMSLSLAPSVEGDWGDGSTGTTPAELAERVNVLEARLAEAESRPARSRSGSRRGAETAEDASASPRALGTPLDATETEPRVPQYDDLGLPVPEESFLARVSAAMTEIERRRKARSAQENLVQRRDKFLASIKKRYRNYREPLQLSGDELERIEKTATTYVDERLDLQADGATRPELEARDREARREIRAILGTDRYRKLRRLELDQSARPVIVDAANRAGVDAGQRKQIETLLADHIERVVDLDVRLRTDEVSDDERRQIREQMNTANRSSWDRLRNDILTDEQRERVPERR